MMETSVELVHFHASFDELGLNDPSDFTLSQPLEFYIFISLIEFQ